MRTYSTKHANSRHGRSETPVWYRWRNMLRRCYDKNNNRYKNYGARGITVEDSWHTFENFYEDFGKLMPAGFTVDRIDNNKPYSKENCQWVSKSENSRKKTTTIYLEYNGKKLSIEQTSREYGVPATTLKRYLSNGLSVEQSIEKYRCKKRG